MKILLIDVNCKYSSTGKIVYDLYQKLHKDGHDVAVCYGRGEKIHEPGIYKFGIDLETKIHAGLARITGLNGYFSPISTARIIKFIDEFKPDVIHIHELHAYFVNIYALLKHIKKTGVKVVWTFHCEYMYTGKCGYSYDCINFQSSCGNCPAVKDYPKSLFFDWTHKMFMDKKKLLEDWKFTVVTPSKWLADRVKLSFLKNHNIIVIHNGIDTGDIFYPRKRADCEDIKKQFGLEGKKIILAVAPNIMDERKGGKTVLVLSEKLKDPNICFVLVGADETRKFNERVQLVSRTKNQDELALWYSTADVFLICSKRENFPTTCLEALSCGTPIVGIDEGGTKETAPAPYGIFVKNDLMLLEDAIRTQLAANFNKDEISLKAKELYAMEVMYRNYLEVYRGLCE